MIENRVLKEFFSCFWCDKLWYASYFVKWRITKVSLPPRLPSQFVLGILGVLIINLFQKIINKRKQTLKASKKNIFHNASRYFLRNDQCLLLFDRKIYSCSIGIVLLMQTVWWGFTRNDFRKNPSTQKIISVVIVLIGTVFTNLIKMKFL
jgi:hypothetical protein